MCSCYGCVSISSVTSTLAVTDICGTNNKIHCLSQVFGSIFTEKKVCPGLDQAFCCHRAGGRQGDHGHEQMGAHTWVAVEGWLSSRTCHSQPGPSAGLPTAECSPGEERLSERVQQRQRPHRLRRGERGLQPRAQGCFSAFAKFLPLCTAAAETLTSHCPSEGC